jgi:thiamine-phosphate pyrophosphorylase
MKLLFNNPNNLYLITGQEHSLERNSFEVAQLAIKGGIDILQMREKTLPKQDKLTLGKKLSTLCKVNTIVFIVNDDPDIAKAVDADGVHLGQEDLEKNPVERVREILGPNKIIGVSTHSLAQIEKANKLNIDYIGFGPIFTTKTKSYSIGTKDINQALRVSRSPVVCIGGINTSNISEILSKGVKNIALIREVTQAADIYKRTKELKKILNEHK